MTTPDLPPPLNAPVQQTTSGLAITSMIMGIISLIGGAFFLFPPILAIIFGHISLSSIRNNPSVGGRGMGVAGLVMGYICIVMFVLVGLMAIPAFNKVRESAQEKIILINAQQIASAAEQYYIDNGVTTVTLETLHAEDYVFDIQPVADETYPSVLTEGEPVVIVRESGESVRID
ncbi:MULTISPECIES: DUF4190 domain-containing protein [unclassified Lentimonas]|uniref:DUF4190 domain-containing protein n=1 Tax=unclassified Lentimonas TaxID=2630993 RepID=UPI0013225EA1|nr:MULTISPECIES: DUF4190 domain-containing protein [unclassified Lentimonas]CAA6676359.1 Unannotated [Lentimonas sp. CC4]CAA6685197.1 Unannotated [Lentimonas sp. CC6]CAA6693372.1 Unannotated [Lentimonas sp. CC19]CAA6696505.1 Unannotated [Lentimonas sp. CC10]CAA7072407.1 Unannotated [Lentimonas sp. CC11]